MKLYKFDKEIREMLMGAVGMPRDVMVEVLEYHLGQKSVGHAIDVLADFIIMARTVVENNREMIEDFLVQEGVLHPHESVKINLPTLFGALNGLALAEGIDENRVCKGCAYRVGTCANQSPVTTCDADWQQNNSDMFWCHENLKEDGSPTRKCTGFLQQRKVNNV